RALIGREIRVAGWVHRRRDHGGVIFIDLRDREGLLQVVFDPDNAAMFAEAERLRGEFVLAVEGRVRERPAGPVHPNLPSGRGEGRRSTWQGGGRRRRSTTTSRCRKSCGCVIAISICAKPR